MPIIQTNSGYGFTYKSEIKKTTKMPPFFKFIVTILIIFVIAVSGIFLSNILSNKLSINKNVYFKKTKLYAVNSGCFMDYDTAYVLSETIKKQGGAGYVYFYENKYNVLLSCYKSNDDCIKVIDNLSQNGIEATLLTIELKEISTSFGEKNSQKSEIYNAINCFYNCYLKLYDFSECYDQDKIGKLEILDEVQKLCNTIKKQKTQFVTNIQNNTNASLVYLKIYMDKLIDVLEKFSLNKINFSGELKHCYFECLKCYMDFRNEIEK